MLTTSELHIEMRKAEPHESAIEMVEAAIKSYGPVLSRIAEALKVTPETVKRWTSSTERLQKALEASKEDQEHKQADERQHKIDQARAALRDAEKEQKLKQAEFMRGYASMPRAEIDKAVARCNAAHEPVKQCRKALNKLLAAERDRQKRAQEKAQNEPAE